MYKWSLGRRMPYSYGLWSGNDNHNVENEERS
jgi:hypothetical protein